MADKGSLASAPINADKVRRFLGKVTFLLAEMGLNTDELMYACTDVICTAIIRFQLDPDVFIEKVFLPHLAMRRASMSIIVTPQ
jgi:hypothetical protein